MIQPNELRIGNWIILMGIDYDAEGNQYHDPLGDQIIKVTAIDLMPGGEPFIVDDHADKVYLEDCSPIPLTSEWLWKFGFQPNPREQRLYIQISEDGWIHYYPGTNEILLATECGYSQFGTRNKIEYVHQLQNLYFALTGEELTIKDDGKKEGKEEKADREVDRRNMGS